MKRNKFGINLDEGIALSNAEDFEILYVEPELAITTRIQDWLKTSDSALLLGGQIGCGKTTLIEYSFYSSEIKPDLVFRFDKESLNLSELDSWSIVFTELFHYIASHQSLNIPEISPEIKKVLGQNCKEWFDSISQIRMETYSSEAIEKNKAFRMQLEMIQNFLPKLFESLMFRLEENKKAPIFIFASGVDKFQPGTAAWFSLSEILQSLSSYKTLYEVNAVHLFSRESWMQAIEKCFISASGEDWIEKILKKRLGVYAGGYWKIIEILADYSGGMPRQALRLLDHFLVEKKLKKSNSEALVQAVENVNRDFFSFGQRPETTLLKVIKKSGFIETSLIGLPGDNETALRAVYGNWIIIKSIKQESQWNASLNPIIEDLFRRELPNDPESQLLKKYAKQQGMSEQGIDINTEISGWQDSLIENLESSLELNISEILDLISSALLSKQRADRIIVAYQDRRIVEVVKAYLMAKSNAYEYQNWQHTALSSDSEVSILLQIIKQMSQPEIDIFSFEFNENCPDEQLMELDLRRDALINQQMIWWIPKQKLNQYLSKWTQLRQLFQVYVLEEAIERTLSVEEIEADLDFMSELEDQESMGKPLYMENLKYVLEYLKGIKHG